MKYLNKSFSVSSPCVTEQKCKNKGIACNICFKKDKYKPIEGGDKNEDINGNTVMHFPV